LFIKNGLNHKRTTSFLAPPMFYEAKNSPIKKDSGLPISAISPNFV